MTGPGHPHPDSTFSLQRFGLTTPHPDPHPWRVCVRDLDLSLPTSRPTTERGCGLPRLADTLEHADQDNPLAASIAPDQDIPF